MRLLSKAELSVVGILDGLCGGVGGGVGDQHRGHDRAAEDHGHDAVLHPGPWVETHKGLGCCWGEESTYPSLPFGSR